MGSVSENRFYLEDNETLVYRSYNNQFETIPLAHLDASGYALTQTCERIEQIRNEFMNYYYGSLPLVNLMFNAKALNEVLTRYNDSIDQSLFWTFIDQLVRIITCGLTLKYTLIDRTDVEARLDVRLDAEIVHTHYNYIYLLSELLKIAEDLLEKAPESFKEIFGQRPKLIIQLLKKIKDSGDFHKHELIEAFINNILEQSAHLDAKEAIKFTKVASDLITSEMTLSWDKMDSQRLNEVLEHLNSYAQMDGLLGKSIYLALQPIYSDLHSTEELLSRPESSKFFELVLTHDEDLSNQSRTMCMALLDHVTKKDSQAAQRESQAKTLLLVIQKNYQDLSDSEMDLLLPLLNTFNFDHSKDKGEALKKLLGSNLMFKLAEYIANKATPEDEFIPLEDCSIVFDNSHIALQLCVFAMDFKNNDIDIPHDKICNVLEQMNLSILETGDLFKLLTTPHKANPINGLAILFAEDPDRYLGSASEAQLAAYYGPKEKGFKLNKSHIKVAKTTPPLPDNADVSIEELEEMFDEINFSDSDDAETYFDPAKVLDESIVVSPFIAKNRLQIFVANIRDRLENLNGVPKDPVEREQFYDELELLVKHTILMLRKLPKGQRAVHIIPFAISGGYCGVRYMNEAINISKILSQMVGMETNQIKEAEEGEGVYEECVKEFIDRILAERRTQILEDQVRKGLPYTLIAKLAEVYGPGLNVHSLTVAKHRFGAEFGVGGGFDDPHDPYKNISLLQNRIIEADRKQLMTACFGEYTPIVIVNEVVKHINGLAGSPKTIKREIHDALCSLLEQEGVDFRVGYTLRLKRSAIVHILNKLSYLELPKSKVIAPIKNVDSIAPKTNKSITARLRSLWDKLWG